MSDRHAEMQISLLKAQLACTEARADEWKAVALSLAKLIKSEDRSVRWQPIETAPTDDVQDRLRRIHAYWHTSDCACDVHDFIENHCGKELDEDQMNKVDVKLSDPPA